MIAASPKSDRLRVKSSPSRARRTSSGCTHTTGILAARAVTTSGFHRCPVATRQHQTGEPRPRGHRLRPGQDLADAPRRPGKHPPGQHHRIMITNHRGLTLRGQIHRHDRPVLADQLTQRLQLRVPAATPRLTGRLPWRTTSSSVSGRDGNPHPPEGRSLPRSLPGVIRKMARCESSTGRTWLTHAAARSSGPRRLTKRWRRQQVPGTGPTVGRPARGARPRPRTDGSTGSGRWFTTT